MNRDLITGYRGQARQLDPIFVDPETHFDICVKGPLIKFGSLGEELSGWSG